MLKPTCRIVKSASLKKDGGLLGRALAAMGGPNQVKVGFPASKTEDGIVDRAIRNEFGTRGSGKFFVRKGKGGKVMGGFGGPVPERPFMRNAMRSNRDKYQRAMAAAARRILRGIMAGENGATLKREALERLGALAQGDIQKEITSLRSPPNSPLTIALKGSSNPLIDTGEMRAAVTWTIED
ncbi:hypothetical protein D3218_19100 [Aureimonas flava]|uniref:Uncharacterized protein n=1 Tax=Aureimonas flava TaxID=2320271 RepID=A0A3A1WME2_9HYPH|nr:hypothetical protein [Aureimonas flava]RIX97169.1 hypothetical protein D3218_19100 [Aureimonas flava]